MSSRGWKIFQQKGTEFLSTVAALLLLKAEQCFKKENRLWVLFASGKRG